MLEIIPPGALRLGVTKDWRVPKDPTTKLDTNSEEWRALRQKVLERDNFKCRYCEFRARNYQIVHHLNGVPDDHGMENLITTCQACNALVHCGFAGAKGWLQLIRTTVSQAALVAMCRDEARQRAYGILKEASPMTMLELAGYERIAILGSQAVVVNDTKGGWMAFQAVSKYAEILMVGSNAVPDWGKDLKALFTPKFDRWQLEFEF